MRKIASQTALLLLFLWTFSACTNSNGVQPEKPDQSGFITESIPGSPLERVVSKDESGRIIQEGFMANGLKEGAWITYHKTGMHAEIVESYAAGKLHGLQLTLSNRGQVEKIANFKNGLMNGYWAELRFGRPTREATYKDNLFHGEYNEYHQNNKLAKRIEYQNGKIHGKFQTYDDQQNLTTDYTYENDKKVSGGIVTKE